MAAAPVWLAGRPERLNARASSQSRSHGSLTCAFIRSLNDPSSTSAYGMTFCNAPKCGSKGRSLYLSPLRDIVGMLAEPATRGSQAFLRATNSSTAFAPPNRIRGPVGASKTPSPRTKSHVPASSHMPHLSHGIHVTRSPAPTLFSTCRRGLNGSLSHPRITVGPEKITWQLYIVKFL
jgi:hypothetical protein